MIYDDDRPCLEGVWLSVSPTDDALIVALDFEGRFDVIYHLLLGAILITENDRGGQFGAFAPRGYPSRSF